LNASDALNLAIKGIAHNERVRRHHAGSNAPVHFITTSMDHNSVLRPLNALAADPLGAPVEWTCLPAHPETGLVDPADLKAAIRPDTALVIAIHASNVSGAIQPVADLGAICRDAGAPFLVDAAQTAGRIPIDTDAMHIDLLAFPGHKYLMGPLGAGALFIRPGLEERIDPLREGGTGTTSESDIHPDTLPDRYEPGSHNTLGIIGLSAGVQWITDQTVDTLWARERKLISQITESLADTNAYPGLNLLGPNSPDNRVGVYSITHDAIPPHELAAVLESEFAILTRAGVHCAPRAHATFGTRDTGGATRLSVGPFNTAEDIERALGALREICAHTAATP
ncbi:MAG: aminotransferase class V-fold PLP-dependent enzyme, partial [Phycisphaerales bacterium]|nr:aminotransferase class V-fold PLP-dependent enzyme [Phycisphaerales bacterium]